MSHPPYLIMTGGAVFDNLPFTLFAILTLTFTYKFVMSVLGERNQNKQIFYQAFKLLPLENSLQTSWDHIEGYFSDRSFPCTLNYRESFSDGVTLIHRVRIELLHQNHISRGIQVKLFYPPEKEDSLSPSSNVFRQQRSALPPLCQLTHEDWSVCLPTQIFYPHLFSHPHLDESILVEDLSLLELIVDRDNLVVTTDIHTETAINQARQMAHFCTRLLDFLPSITTTEQLNTPYHVLYQLILDGHVLRGDAHIISLLNVLLEHTHQHPFLHDTWMHLLEDRSLENFYYFFTYCPSEVISKLSDEELLDYFQRMAMSDLTIPDTHLLTLLPRFSLSILCDLSLALPWKLRILSLWLEDESEARHSTQELQHAIRDMILAHPFERQRIQQHISRSSGLATRQDGQLSLSHGLSHGSLSMLPELEE